MYHLEVSNKQFTNKGIRIPLLAYIDRNSFWIAYESIMKYFYFWYTEITTFRSYANNVLKNNRIHMDESNRCSKNTNTELLLPTPSLRSGHLSDLLESFKSSNAFSSESSNIFHLRRSFRNRIGIHASTSFKIREMRNMISLRAIV